MGHVEPLNGTTKKFSIDDVIRKHFGEQENYTVLSNIFNETFAKAIDDLKSKIGAQSEAPKYGSGPTNSAYLPEIELEDLSEIVRNMSIQKPPGRDKIRPRDVYHDFDQLKNIALLKEYRSAHLTTARSLIEWFFYGLGFLRPKERWRLRPL